MLEILTPTTDQRNQYRAPWIYHLQQNTFIALSVLTKLPGNIILKGMRLLTLLKQKKPAQQVNTKTTSLILN